MRRLTADQLAEEAGVDITMVEKLVDAGVVAPGPDGLYTTGDLIRADSARAFMDAGIDLATIKQGIAAGLFTFEYLDRFTPAPAALTDASMNSLATMRGLDPGLVADVYVAMGLPDREVGERLREDEREMLASLLDLWSPSGSDALMRAARLLGESVRFLAEGWARLYVEKVSDPMVAQGLPIEERIPLIVDSTEKTTLLAPSLMVWLFHRHVRGAIDRANIEGLESSLAEHGHPLPRPARLPAIVFVDVSGFTTLTERLGDEAALATADAVARVARAVAREHEGSLVKTLGDGAMLHFNDAARSVAAAMAAVSRLADEGIDAHAGVHAGPVIEHDRDFFGSTVNIAARVAALAGPGEVMVTDALVAHAGHSDLTFRPRDAVELKGIAEPVPVFLAEA